MAHYTVAQSLPSADDLFLRYIFFKHTRTLLNVMDVISNILSTYTNNILCNLCSVHALTIPVLAIVCKSRAFLQGINGTVLALVILCTETEVMNHP